MKHLNELLAWITRAWITGLGQIGDGCDRSSAWLPQPPTNHAFGLKAKQTQGASPHPLAPSPKRGEGEQDFLKVPLPLWERDLG